MELRIGTNKGYEISEDAMRRMEYYAERHPFVVMVDGVEYWNGTLENCQWWISVSPEYPNAIIEPMQTEWILCKFGYGWDICHGNVWVID